MARITRLVLDILKPHDPPIAAFAVHLAESASGLTVMVDVIEIDDMTQTLEVIVEGDNLDLDDISAAITALGASLHSIDKVQVVNDSGTD
jgi:hypothetical protein